MAYVDTHVLIRQLNASRQNVNIITNRRLHNIGWLFLLLTFIFEFQRLNDKQAIAPYLTTDNCINQIAISKRMWRKNPYCNYTRITIEWFLTILSEKLHQYTLFCEKEFWKSVHISLNYDKRTALVFHDSYCIYRGMDMIKSLQIANNYKQIITHRSQRERAKNWWTCQSCTIQCM